MLACPLAAKNNGAATVPLNCTLLFPSVVGSGRLVAAVVCEARPVPNTVAMLPGTTESPAWNPAALTVPAEGTTGGAALALTASAAAGDVPPPGVGFDTVTCPVAALATS